MTTEGINKYGFLKIICLVIDWVSVSDCCLHQGSNCLAISW